MLDPNFWLKQYPLLMGEWAKELQFREVQLEQIARYYPGYTDKQIKEACNALCSHHLLPGRVTLSALILELMSSNLHPYRKEEFEEILTRAAL